MEDVNPEKKVKFIVHDTLCRQVSGREPELRKFAQNYDVIIFVSGQKSSNGKMLFKACKNENPESYFISDKDELLSSWFFNASTVGVCGATSTPRWLMEDVMSHIKSLV